MKSLAQIEHNIKQFLDDFNNRHPASSHQRASSTRWSVVRTTSLGNSQPNSPISSSPPDSVSLAGFHHRKSRRQRMLFKFVSNDSILIAHHGDYITPPMRHIHKHLSKSQTLINKNEDTKPNRKRSNSYPQQSCHPEKFDQGISNERKSSDPFRKPSPRFLPLTTNFNLNSSGFSSIMTSDEDSDNDDDEACNEKQVYSIGTENKRQPSNSFSYSGMSHTGAVFISQNNSNSSSRRSSIFKAIRTPEMSQNASNASSLTSLFGLSFKKHRNDQLDSSTIGLDSNRTLLARNMSPVTLLSQWDDVFALQKDHVMDETSANIFNVIEILQERFLILTGGTAKDGSLILTFTDNNNNTPGEKKSSSNSTTTSSNTGNTLSSPSTNNTSNSLNYETQLAQQQVQNYRKAVDYYLKIPSEQDRKLGFTVVIDRRSDKWSSVNFVLNLIYDYFPAKLNTIFVIRPQSYLQRILSTFYYFSPATATALVANSTDTVTPQEANNNNKNGSLSSTSSSSTTENRPTSRPTNIEANQICFNIKICKSIEELNEWIDPASLTTDLGGAIHYRHQDWLEQRQFIEKLSLNVNECVANLRQFINTMAENTDFPNSIDETQQLIASQQTERQQLLDNVQCTRRFGETVLNLIEKTSKIDMFKEKTEKFAHLSPDIRIHYQAVTNLLKLMEESERTLDLFWQNHFIRLNKCLDLRKFEQKFKNVRMSILSVYEKLNQIASSAASLESEPETTNVVKKITDLDNESQLIKKQQTDCEKCLTMLQQLGEQSKNAFNDAFNLYNQGIQLLLDKSVEQIKNNHEHLASNEGAEKETKSVVPPPANGYCVDSVEPKTVYLKNLIDDFHQDYAAKTSLVRVNKVLLNKIHQAKEFYSKGVKLFNEQSQQQQLQSLNNTYTIDKVHKYLYEIEHFWFRPYNELLAILNKKIEIEEDSSSLSHRSINTIAPLARSVSSTTANVDLTTSSFINSNIGSVVALSNNLSSNKSVTDQLETKRASLVKNLNTCLTQLNSLNVMYEKRRELLTRQIASFQTKNSIKCNSSLVTTTTSNNTNNDSDSYKSSNSSTSSTSSSFSLTRKDSAMLKSFDRGNLYETLRNITNKKDKTTNELTNNTTSSSYRSSSSNRSSKSNNLTVRLSEINRAKLKRRSSIDTCSSMSSFQMSSILSNPAELNVVNDHNQQQVNKAPSSTSSTYSSSSSSRSSQDSGILLDKSHRREVLVKELANDAGGDVEELEEELLVDDEEALEQLNEDKKTCIEKWKKVRHILDELLESERVYVNELKIVTDGFLAKLNDNSHLIDSDELPSLIIDNKDVLFGNIQEIYNFHKNTFLKGIEDCLLADLNQLSDLENNVIFQWSIPDVCNLFINMKPSFFMYSTYCVNKQNSDEFWREHCMSCPFFKVTSQELGLKLPLDSYLLKPIQRIGKYQLILKELHKTLSALAVHAEKINDAIFQSILNVDMDSLVYLDKICNQAYETIVNVNVNINDMMHASFIQTDPIKNTFLNAAKQESELGRLLKRGQLQMARIKLKNATNTISGGSGKDAALQQQMLANGGSFRSNSIKSNMLMFNLNRFQFKTVEVFLFEKALLVCKRKQKPDSSEQTGANSSSAVSGGQSIQAVSVLNLNTLSGQASCGTNNCPYIYLLKESIKTDEIGLTENLKSDKKKFEIWLNSSSCIFEATSEIEKKQWTETVKLILENQLMEMKKAALAANTAINRAHKLNITTNSHKASSNRASKSSTKSSTSSSSSSSSSSYANMDPLEYLLNSRGSTSSSTSSSSTSSRHNSQRICNIFDHALATSNVNSQQQQSAQDVVKIAGQQAKLETSSSFISKNNASNNLTLKKNVSESTSGINQNNSVVAPTSKSKSSNSLNQLHFVHVTSTPDGHDKIISF